MGPRRFGRDGWKSFIIPFLFSLIFSDPFVVNAAEGPLGGSHATTPYSPTTDANNTEGKDPRPRGPLPGNPRPMISTQDWLAEGGRTLLPVEIPRIDILQNTDNVDLVVLYPDGRPDPENRDTDKPNPAAWEGYLQESEDASLAQRIPAELRLAGNPDSIARYLHQNFTYETDQSQFGIEDYWQTPQEFLLSRKGDCEDFAVFSHTILKMNGRKSFVLAIVSPLDAHTVTIFKEDEKFDALDVARVRRFGTLTIRGLIPKLSPYWKYGAIVAMSYSTHSPRIVKKIES